MYSDEDNGLINESVNVKVNAIPDSARKQSCLRWIAVLCTSLILFGPNYVQSNAISLEEELSQAPFYLSQREYGLLFTSYQATATFFPLLGGFLADFLGVRKSLLLFTALFTLGQISFFWGLYMTDYYFLILGRFFISFMLAATVTIYKALSYMFRHSELAFAMAFSFALSRIAIPIESFITPSLYDQSNLIWASAILGLGLCCISLISTLLLGCVQWRIKKGRGQEAAVRRVREVTFKETFNFGRLYWLIALMIALAFSSMMCFYNSADEFGVLRFGLEESKSTSMKTIIPFVFSLVAPIMGIIIDHYGKRPLFMTVGLLFLTGSHLMLMFFKNYDGSNIIALPYTFMGIGAGVFGAAVWPSIALLVDQKLTGMAYGVALTMWQIIQAFVLIGGDAIVQRTSDNKFGYYYFELLMLVLPGAAAIISVYAFCMDATTYGKLLWSAAGVGGKSPEKKKKTKKSSR